MKKSISTIALAALTCHFAQAQFANQTLSNLSPTTAVNQTLLPGTANIFNLGSTTKPWKNLNLKGDIYIDGFVFLRSVTNKQGTYVGKNAGPASTSTGLLNTALGFTALSSTTTGGNNTALGANVLTANTTGSNNTAVGQNALNASATGDGNIAIGIDALNYHTNISNNIAIGNGTMAWGDSPRDSSAPSGSNTVVGSNSLLNGGNFNTVLGADAMVFQTVNPQFNTAIGYGTGPGALGGTVTNNTSLGLFALYFLYGGSNNTAIGENSALIQSQGVTANNSTFLGSETTIEAANLTNATAIGYQARGLANNQVVVGNSSITSIGGYANWTNFSDGRYKKNIKENVPGLEFIKQLHPVTYTLDVEGINKSAPAVNNRPTALSNKASHANLPGNVQGGSTPETKPFVWAKDAKVIAGDAKAVAEKSKIVYTGFVAQDVEAAAEKLNYDFSGVKKPANDKDYYGLRYAEFVVPLVKAVQELSTKNDALTEQNTQLEARLTAIEQLLAKTNGGISLNNNSLGQNIPNPSKGSTLIPFNLLAENNNASIVITEAGSGKILKTVTVNPSQKSISIQLSNFASGTYIYSLIANGKTVDSKKMVIAR